MQANATSDSVGAVGLPVSAGEASGASWSLLTLKKTCAKPSRLAHVPVHVRPAPRVPSFELPASMSVRMAIVTGSATLDTATVPPTEETATVPSTVTGSAIVTAPSTVTGRGSLPSTLMTTGSPLMPMPRGYGHPASGPGLRSA